MSRIINTRQVLALILSLCGCNIVFAGDMGSKPWTGWNVGGNLGAWWSQNDAFSVTGTPSFVNQTYVYGASRIANALSQVADDAFQFQAYGFLGGAQLGYHRQTDNRFVWGVDADLDGLSNSASRVSRTNTVSLADLDEQYTRTLVVQQKLNYLGTVRARMGYLYVPSLLLYGTGGFSYGSITQNTTWTANESLGPTVYPTVSNLTRLTRTLGGWTAGGGAEWRFERDWSVSLEYIFYSLNVFNSSVALQQINATQTPATLWGSAIADSALSAAMGSMRVGVNYHFS